MDYYWHLMDGMGYLEVGTEPEEIEEVPIKIACLIEYTSWEERHPLWGTPQCPEPYVEKQGWRMTEIWTAVPYPPMFKGMPGTFETDEGSYHVGHELTDYFSKVQFYALEREVFEEERGG